jgi:hypothetical protein
VDIAKALVEGVTQDIVAYLIEDNGVSIDQALKTVYSSVLFEKLSDVETGLYRESSPYVYSILKDELAGAKFVQVEI